MILFLPIGSGRLWNRLQTSAGLRDHLVQGPFVKYVRFELEGDNDNDNGLAPQRGNGNGNSNNGSDSGAKWFAEFGARNLMIGGPLSVRCLEMNHHHGYIIRPI
jgi:hypothetical protein